MLHQQYMIKLKARHKRCTKKCLLLHNANSALLNNTSNINIINLRYSLMDVESRTRTSVVDFNIEGNVSYMTNEIIGIFNNSWSPEDKKWHHSESICREIWRKIQVIEKQFATIKVYILIFYKHIRKSHFWQGLQWGARCHKKYFIL